MILQDHNKIVKISARDGTVYVGNKLIKRLLRKDANTLELSVKIIGIGQKYSPCTRRTVVQPHFLCTGTAQSPYCRHQIQSHWYGTDRLQERRGEIRKQHQLSLPHGRISTWVHVTTRIGLTITQVGECVYFTPQQAG